MASDDENQQSPFAKPGFLISAVIVVLVVVAGVFLGIMNATRDDPESDAATPAPSSATPTPTSEPVDMPSGDSICNLAGESLSGTLSTAPETTWEYQDTFAYPTSPEFGPGETNAESVRYCFQRSPEGALFAAANAAVQSSGPASVEWMNYFLADETANRQELLTDLEPSAGVPPDMRMSIDGFKFLSYDGNNTRIDLGSRIATSGETIYMSAVYDLVWENGDWKLLPQDSTNPLRVAQIPDLAGYVSWRE
ncbi:hypothetical protein [Arthrobacter citreus]|uniref:hypothetical protein n=1 Tax=Arthrobacter citreus TaxID=1670 RepID=UPI0037F143E9